MGEKSKLKTEILVIGAGPAGSITSARLSQAGYDVLLIDKASFPREKTCGDALSPLAVKRLAEIGVLAEVVNSGANIIESASITGTTGIKVQANFKDFLDFQRPYGLAMPRFEFDNILLQHAVQEGAAFQSNLNVLNIIRAGKDIQKVLAASSDNKIEIEAKHYVIAVGANIGLLRRNGFVDSNIALATASRSYYEVGQDIANSFDFFYEKDLMPGYGWVFPVGNGTINIGVGAWASKKVSKKNLDGFIEKLVARNSIPSPISVGKMKGYPLRTDFPSQKLSGNNWLLAGESAGLVNPLTGEGIDLAIESGLVAAEEITNSIKHRSAYADRYQNILEDRYRNMFVGMNLLRKFVINPVALNRLLDSMRKYPGLFHTFLEVSMGIKPPTHLLKSKFLLGFLGK